MGGRPEMRVAKVEGLGVVVVVVFCCLLLLLQQGGLGGGIAVVIVGMVSFSSISSSLEEVGECWRLSFFMTVASSSSSSSSAAAAGMELRTQQQGPRDLSHWHPVVAFVVSGDSVVKASSQVM